MECPRCSKQLHSINGNEFMSFFPCLDCEIVTGYQCVNGRAEYYCQEMKKSKEIGNELSKS